MEKPSTLGKISIAVHVLLQQVRVFRPFSASTLTIKNWIFTPRITRVFFKNRILFLSKSVEKIDLASKSLPFFFSFSKALQTTAASKILPSTVTNKKTIPQELVLRLQPAFSVPTDCLRKRSNFAVVVDTLGLGFKGHRETALLVLTLIWPKFVTSFDQ